MMGVPAYPQLAKGTHFPPFNMNDLGATALKRLAGNDAWRCLVCLFLDP